MPDVFISYSRDDEAVARRVAKALAAAGFDVWWDAELPAHRAYSEVIERNLEEAKAVVVLWSKTAAKSQWVRAEADYARNAGKLVQATVDRSIPPLPFNQIQSADLKGWRGRASQSGCAKLQASVQALVCGEERPADATAQPQLLDRLQPYRWWIAAAVAVVVAAGILFWAFGRSGEEHKPVLAVLPFTSIDARDESLVAGMWEDTRNAIGRNPQLVVLGPNTAEQLGKKGEGAAKRAADYVLQASVRTLGDRIRISTGLVRSRDGAQLWSQNFDRKLDDVFALQSEIAQQIEGRIRGRLAQGGGVKPENIATSGTVYALYSDARAKIRTRDSQLYPAARNQLEQVVRLDPNFAPGWASLAIVYSMIPPDQIEFNPYDRAQQYARRAIELAPNLAAGHAALAFTLDGGPLVRTEIQRAVQLDPNDFEAVNWLGNSFNAEGRWKEALAAYTRAAEIEPLFWPAVTNKLIVLQVMHDEAGIRQLIEEEERLGAEHLVLAIKMYWAGFKGNLAEEANIAIDYLKSGRAEDRALFREDLWGTLLQLGYIDEASKLTSAPSFAPYLWRNESKGLDMVEALHLAPRKFFSMSPLSQNAGRVYVLSGRSRKLADMYLSLNVSPQEFLQLTGVPEFFSLSAPIVAAALRETGHADDAARLLALAASTGEELNKSGYPMDRAMLARVYAAQNRKDEALALLTACVNDNWLPQPPYVPIDLAFDPAFASLKGDPRFERLRERILGTIKRERAQVRIAELS